MNWYTVILVFHVLRLNLCVAALNQVCPERQFLNASGVCVDCTICIQSDKNIVIRKCTALEDTICGSISDLNIDLPGIKVKSKYKNDISNQYLTINTDADLSKENITEILKKLSNPVESMNEASMDASNYYYYDDDDADDDEYPDDDNNTSTAAINSTSSNLPTVKKPNRKTSSDESNKQSKKDTSSSKSTKPIQTIYTDVLSKDEVSVVDPDTLIQKPKKFKLKESTVEINDHLLKIGDTKFKIGEEEKPDDGRWLQLSHPHIVNRTVYFDLAAEPAINKKGSTFFSSGEKLTDEEYAKQMNKLLNATSLVLDEKHPIVQNHSVKINSQEDYPELRNLDDIDGAENDDGDDEDNEEDDDDEEDEDTDDDSDDEDANDDDEPLNYNDIISNNNSASVENQDFEMEDDYDLPESDYSERPSNVHIPTNDIIAEPFVPPVNWQILILVAAMSACLLFFIVISAYVCIYMRKRRHSKTTILADVEDLSVLVNLMQHAAFEPDESNNIRNYITQLRSVKSINDKPPIYIRTK